MRPGLRGAALLRRFSAGSCFSRPPDASIVGDEAKVVDDDEEDDVDCFGGTAGCFSNAALGLLMPVAVLILGVLEEKTVCCCCCCWAPPSWPPIELSIVVEDVESDAGIADVDATPDDDGAVVVVWPESFFGFIYLRAVSNKVLYGIPQRGSNMACARLSVLFDPEGSGCADG